MNAPSDQPIPPKLQQLLAVLPDVDRVSLLAIANHYKMDLDDPSYLPLLLTQQGISALDKSKAEMVVEVRDALDLVADRIAAAAAMAREVETAQIEEHSRRCADFLRRRAAESEAAMHQALASWAPRAIDEALAQAISRRVQAAANIAITIAEATAANAAKKFSAEAEVATREVQQAAEAAGAAAREARAAVRAAGQGQVSWVWMPAAFFAGLLLATLVARIAARFFG